MTWSPLLGESDSIETAPSQVNVCVHASQFPERVAEALRGSLRARRIHPKFHYQTHKQAAQWLALHEAYSPARARAGVLEAYDKAFHGLAARLPGSSKCQVIGLGCGGGHKEARLAEILASRGHAVSFVPVDASLPLVLTAWARHRRGPAAGLEAPSIVPPHPAGIVCDLEDAPGLPDLLAGLVREGGPRVVCFFGLLPNLDPSRALPMLRRLLGPADWLLASANLLPGPDEDSGIARVLPQYQNPITEQWLKMFLSDLGAGDDHGAIIWRVERGAGSIPSVCLAAVYQCGRPCRITAEGEDFIFGPGDEIRLFHSSRFRPEHIRPLLSQHGLDVRESWIEPEGEEGIFLCGRPPTM